MKRQRTKSMKEKTRLRSSLINVTDFVINLVEEEPTTLC